MAGAKLEKISDTNVYLFIAKGLWGRISYIAKRYNEPNNKYMKNYDPTKPSNNISYLDMNNFYGCAMNIYLPYGGFKWLRNVDGFDIHAISEKKKSDVLHNDYPLAPEKPAIT